MYKFRVVYLLKHFYYSWETVKNVALLYLISVNSADRQIYPTFESFSEIGSSWLSPSNFCYIHSFFSTKDWRKGETLFLFCLFQYKTWMKCQAWLTKKAGLKSLIFSSLPPTRNCVKLNSKIESFPKAILVTMRKRKRRGRRNPN